MSLLLNNFSNMLLTSTPGAFVNTVFYKSIMYVISHGSDGAIGLLLNVKLSFLYDKKFYLGGLSEPKKIFLLPKGSELGPTSLLKNDIIVQLKSNSDKHQESISG